MNATETKIAKLDKAGAEYVGWDLRIDADTLDLPNGCGLPQELALCSVHVRHRGIYLGRRWYLQAPHRAAKKDTVDLVSPEEVEGSMEVCKAFLARHGYRCQGELPPGAFEYVR